MACSNHICLPRLSRKHQCSLLHRADCQIISLQSVLGEVGVNPKHSHTLPSVPDQALGLRAFCFSILSPRNLEKWDSSPVTPEVSNPNESFGIPQQPGGKNTFLTAGSGLGISRITLWSCSLPHLL